MLTFLLVTGFLASETLAAGPTKPVPRPVTQQDVDAALAPLPGISFTQPSAPSGRSAAEKRAKDRFTETEHWAALRAYTGPCSGHLSATAALGRVQRRHGGSGYENITATTAYGTQYGVDVRFDTQKLTLALDTGSSDTWAVSARANCTSLLSSCAFGPSFVGDFDAEAALDEHLFVQYGDGEVVQGPMGYLSVALAGLEVVNQTVALANDTFWVGNNVTSGILGLAYPSITNAYTGPFGDHSPWYQREYAPIFANMVAQGLSDNFFSIALSRHAGSHGALGFGGVPDNLDGVDYDTLAMTDIIIANLVDQEQTAYHYSFYTIIPDGWMFGTSTDDRKVPYIIDTGTMLTYLPDDLAASINAAFEPPAAFDYLRGAYYTACDAAPPRVAVVVGGAPLWLAPADLLLRRQPPHPLTGACMTAVAAAGAGGPFVLGGAFLTAVLAVFDVGDAVVQFASRRDY